MDHFFVAMHFNHLQALLRLAVDSYLNSLLLHRYSQLDCGDFWNIIFDLQNRTPAYNLCIQFLRIRNFEASQVLVRYFPGGPK